MQAREVNFLKFMQGTKQFHIPIYQRTYSWTLKQCEQLWNDIVRSGSPDVNGQFVGSIVYIEKGLYQAASVPQLLMIDGQQRLTTLSLLLAALGKSIQASGKEIEITQKKLHAYYLFNVEEEDDLRQKLVLTQSDKETLARLIEGKEAPPSSARRLVENFQFFENKLASSGVPLSTIYAGIQKLIVVDIALDRQHDNPQLIFESLNSTGLELSQADLIRNFVLMGLDPLVQAELYKEHWFPMESGFGHAEYAELFDRFMRDYLTVKTGRIPNIGEVYESFKAYVRSKSSVPVGNLVADIHRFADHFIALALERIEDQDVRRAIGDINTLRVDVAYPFLLRVYDDYKRGQITRDDVLEILGMVENYVFRRSVCGIPTNSMNKTFLGLSTEIDEANYVGSIRVAFRLMDSYRRFPTDEEFQTEFISKDVYNFRNRNYLLRKLENHDRKEPVNVETYTIEHVMPQNQNLPASWQKELGPKWKEVHAQHLHSVGNLTLTGYNSELSDRSFLEKKAMKGGFADSPIRLNRSLAALEHWNEEEIRKRANELAALARKVWPSPSPSKEDLDRFRKMNVEPAKKTYTLADHEQLTGPMLELFTLLRTRILNLDSSVREEILKLYIAYKSTTNFVDIVPQKSRLRLSLNVSVGEIEDPRGICKDVSGLGRWGNGDVEVGISNPADIDYVMTLIKQAHAKQEEDETA